MTTTLAPDQIEADTMKQIRRAARNPHSSHSVYLAAVTCHRRQDDGQFQLESTIEFRTTVRQPEGTTPDRVETLFAVPARQFIQDYIKESPGRQQHLGTWSDPMEYRLFAGHEQYKFEKGNTLQSIANVGRVGDVFEIRWLLGNVNGHMKDAGLTQDKCFIRLLRDGQFVAEFPLMDTTFRASADIVGMVSNKYLGA